MYLNSNETEYLEYLSTLAGVKVEDTLKIFKALVLDIVLQVLDKIENEYPTKKLKRYDLNVSIPFLIKSCILIIREYKNKDKLGIDLKFQLSNIFIDNYLIVNIKQILNKESPCIQEEIKKELFKELKQISKKN